MMVPLIDQFNAGNFRVIYTLDPEMPPNFGRFVQKPYRPILVPLPTATSLELRGLFWDIPPNSPFNSVLLIREYPRLSRKVRSTTVDDDSNKH